MPRRSGHGGRTQLTGSPKNPGRFKLIVNGDFSEESQKTGWDQNGTWDGTQDVDGQADSGSLRFDNTGFGFYSAVQCVNVPPGTYTLSAWVLVPSGQLVSGDGRTGVSAWNDAPDCTGSFTLTDVLEEISSLFDVWENLTQVYIAPSGTQSAQVFVQNFNVDDSSTFVSYFDDVSFVPEPSINILQISVLLTLALFARRRVTI